MNLRVLWMLLRKNELAVSFSHFSELAAGGRTREAVEADLSKRHAEHLWPSFS
jgi:hypothetical protein